MYYKSIIDYLIENVRNPIKENINDEDKVMEVVDYILWKYIEQNSMMNAYEKIMSEHGIKLDSGSEFNKWSHYLGEFNKEYYEKLKDGWDNYKAE